MCDVEVPESFVAELRGDGLWCNVCGTPSTVVYELRGICPYSSSGPSVRLCPTCAKKLLHDLYAALAGLRCKDTTLLGCEG